MREISIGWLRKTKIVLYETIEDLPVSQYNLIQEYALKDSEIGGGVDEILKKISNIVLLTNEGSKEQVIATATNLYQSIWLTQHHVNFKSMQFGCLIFSINGKVVTDYSESNLLKILNELSNKGLTQATVKTEIDMLKKAFYPNSN